MGTLLCCRNVVHTHSHLSMHSPANAVAATARAASNQFWERLSHARCPLFFLVRLHFIHAVCLSSRRPAKAGMQISKSRVIREGNLFVWSREESSLLVHTALHAQLVYCVCARSANSRIRDVKIQSAVNAAVDVLPAFCVLCAACVSVRITTCKSFMRSCSQDHLAACNRRTVTQNLLGYNITCAHRCCCCTYYIAGVTMTMRMLPLLLPASGHARMGTHRKIYAPTADARCCARATTAGMCSIFMCPLNGCARVRSHIKRRSREKLAHRSTHCARDGSGGSSAASSSLPSLRAHARSHKVVYPTH